MVVVCENPSTAGRARAATFNTTRSSRVVLAAVRLASDGNPRRPRTAQQHLRVTKGDVSETRAFVVFELEPEVLRMKGDRASDILQLVLNTVSALDET